MRVAYIGGIGRTYDLATVRRAVALIGAELVVAGGEHPLGRVDLERLLASCDVGVVPMSEDSWVGVPNKMFDYAKAGLPIASSLGGEAAELLEVFQWSGSDLGIDGKKDKIKEEWADIANYCILMADVCGLDLDEIIREKVARNAEKYPVDKAYGNKDKYTKWEDGK